MPQDAVEVVILFAWRGLAVDLGFLPEIGDGLEHFVIMREIRKPDQDHQLEASLLERPKIARESLDAVLQAAIDNKDLKKDLAGPTVSKVSRQDGGIRCDIAFFQSLTGSAGLEIIINKTMLCFPTASRAISKQQPRQLLHDLKDSKHLSRFNDDSKSFVKNAYEAVDELCKNTQPSIISRKLDEHQQKLLKPLFNQLPFFVSHSEGSGADTVTVFGQEALEKIWKTTIVLKISGTELELSNVNLFQHFDWLLSAEIKKEVEEESKAIWDRYQLKATIKRAPDLDVEDLMDTPAKKSRPKANARTRFFGASGSKSG